MSTIKADNIANLSGVSTTVTSVVYGSAKAWVNFNGTGTVAVRGAYNVSSITDNAIGDYTINFFTALGTANYCAVGMAQREAANDEVNLSIKQGVTPTTSALRIRAVTPSSNSAQDPLIACVAVFSF